MPVAWQVRCDAQLKLLAELRELVEQKHREAVEALDVLEGLVSWVPSVQPVSVEALVPSNGSRVRKGSIKEKVVEAIRGQSKSVDQICSATSLGSRQVRGVLYAPDMTERIGKDSGPQGEAVFRLIEEKSLLE